MTDAHTGFRSVHQALESSGRLTSAKRKKLPKSEFGLPGERKYPMPNRSHAANAKARASEEEHKGRITPGQKREIDAKANRILGKGRKRK